VSLCGDDSRRGGESAAPFDDLAFDDLGDGAVSRATTTIGSVETLRRTLHERGFRMTPQRQLVLDAVTELGHATPEQICASVRRLAPAVNITTVYRTLDLLERLGVVRHTHLGHGAPTYSVREHEHVHLVCHWCGAVSEIPIATLDELTERLATDFSFRLDACHVALSGACVRCATERPEAGAAVGAGSPAGEAGGADGATGTGDGADPRSRS
jgi:Fur family transcriptional regulator, ferric uptake regulator